MSTGVIAIPERCRRCLALTLDRALPDYCLRRVDRHRRPPLHPRQGQQSGYRARRWPSGRSDYQPDNVLQATLNTQRVTQTRVQKILPIKCRRGAECKLKRLVVTVLEQLWADTNSQY